MSFQTFEHSSKRKIWLCNFEVQKKKEKKTTKKSKDSFVSFSIHIFKKPRSDLHNHSASSNLGIAWDTLLFPFFFLCSCPSWCRALFFKIHFRLWPSHTTLWRRKSFLHLLCSVRDSPDLSAVQCVCGAPHDPRSSTSVLAVRKTGSFIQGELCQRMVMI